MSRNKRLEKLSARLQRPIVYPTFSEVKQCWFKWMDEHNKPSKALDEAKQSHRPFSSLYE